MKFHKTMAILFCVTLMIPVTACSKNEQTNGSVSSRTQSSSSLIPQGASSSASTSASSKPISSAPNSVNSATKKHSSKSTSSVKNVTSKTSSKKSKSGGEWVAYDTNKDGYKLHIKKADGTEDKVILNDTVLAPCVAGDWVYYIYPLQEIDKIKVDGSQKTKVCDIDAMDALNANTAVTAEYRDGCILYKIVQLREVGDSRPNTVTYYKLDIKSNKITEVKSN